MSRTEREKSTLRWTSLDLYDPHEGLAAVVLSASGSLLLAEDKIQTDCSLMQKEKADRTLPNCGPEVHSSPWPQWRCLSVNLGTSVPLSGGCCEGPVPAPSAPRVPGPEREGGSSSPQTGSGSHEQRPSSQYLSVAT